MAEENVHWEQLRLDYQEAFGEWALEVNRLQEIDTAASSSTLVTEAEERVAAAEVTYRHTRDLLTDEIAHPSD